MAAPSEKNVLVGSENGILKFIDVGRKSWANCAQNDKPDRSKEICTICWKDDEESEALFAQKNRTVKLFDIQTNEITSLVEFPGESNLVGLCSSENMYVTGLASGLVNLWNHENEEVASFEAGDLYRLRINDADPAILATGGKENDLKLWNIENLEKPIFHAKNVPHDWLNLRVPVWVTDMQFLDSQKVVVCTGHHQVRVYDPRGPQKRPVLDFSHGEYPFTCMTRVDEHQVVVGDTVGKMALIDIRNKGPVVQLYKGFSGGVTSVQYHSKMKALISTSLDRCVRIHDLNSKKLKNKFYLKSRLKSALVASQGWRDLTEKLDEKSVKQKKRKQAASDDEIDEDDDVWDNMETTNKKKSGKSAAVQNVKTKKKKKLK